MTDTLTLSSPRGTPSHRHHLKQARRSLQGLADDIQFADDEREFFADDIAALQGAIRKLDRGCLTVAVFGAVGRGKSSVANALLKRDLFEMAPVHGTTRSLQKAHWASSRFLEREGSEGESSEAAGTDSPASGDRVIRHLDILDTPGLNDVDGDAYERLSRQAARQADLILFVIAGDMTEVEHRALAELRQVNKPMVLAFNKIDLYPDRDRQAIFDSLTSPQLQQLIAPDDIALIAARPKPEPVEVRWPDGRVEITWEQSDPDIQDLELKLERAIARDGVSLLALNALLFAKDWRDRVARKKVRLRSLQVQSVIWKYAGWKSIAVALNPIPGLDVLAGIAIDWGLITAVSRHYGLPLTFGGSGTLLKRLLLGWGGFVAVEIASSVGLGLGKFAAVGTAIATDGLSLGTSITAYSVAALAQASAAGLTAYLVGRAARDYLQQGDRWDEASPTRVLRSLLDTLAPTSALNALKRDLDSQLEAMSLDAETQLD